MKEKFMRFMQGRYGVLDTLGKVFAGVGIGSGIFLHLSFQETM